MERIYTIGTFTFKLIYDEKLIKIPPNFQIFESQEEPEYTYEFIVRHYHKQKGEQSLKGMSY